MNQRIRDTLSPVHHVYSICALLTALLSNQLAYQGARVLSFWRFHYNFSLPLDAEIPLLPWTQLIYFGAFLFWTVNLYLCSQQPREEADRLFCADILVKLVSFVIFVIVPTTNVRPEVTGSGFFEYTLRLLYRIDRADNLFPSLHCSLSWLCWVGIRRRRDIPLGYRAFSLFFALAVCLSTLTTRQHVFVDTVSGIALAEICYAVVGHTQVRICYTKWMDRLLMTVSKYRAYFTIHLGL